MLMHAMMFKASHPPRDCSPPDLMPQIEPPARITTRAMQVHPVTFVAFRQSPWHHYGVLGLEQTQVAIRSPYLDNDVVKMVYRAPGSVAANEEGRLRLIREGNPALADLRTDRGIGGPNSVFTRGFLEFLFKAEYAYDYGMPQWAARLDHLFAPFHLERLWLGRHKSFIFACGIAMSLQTMSAISCSTRRSLARPYLVPETVRTIVNGHVKGDHNYTTEIHRLLTLELTHRLFLDVPVNVETTVGPREQLLKAFERFSEWLDRYGEVSTISRPSTRVPWDNALSLSITGSLFGNFRRIPDRFCEAFVPSARSCFGSPSDFP